MPVESKMALIVFGNVILQVITKRFCDIIRTLFSISKQQCTGIPFCPQLADKAVDILCKLGAVYRNPDKINGYYQSLTKAIFRRTISTQKL